jgi:hypothetical protein
MPVEQDPGTSRLGGQVVSKDAVDGLNNRKISNPTRNRTMNARTSSSYLATIPNMLSLLPFLSVL